MKSLFTLIALIAMSLMNAQKIDIKKDVVLMDGKPFLKYEKIDLSQYSLRDLAGNEVLFYQIKQSENTLTPHSYVVLNFVGIRRKFESDSGPNGLGAKNMMENVISWLMRDKVFNTDGTVNVSGLDVFENKYADHKH